MIIEASNIKKKTKDIPSEKRRKKKQPKTKTTTTFPYSNQSELVTHSLIYFCGLCAQRQKIRNTTTI